MFRVRDRVRVRINLLLSPFNLIKYVEQFECDAVDLCCTLVNGLLLQLSVKFGRALQKGEYKVKVYQLSINDAEVSCVAMAIWILNFVHRQVL